ncbi:MAG TPA: zinc ribbon domain-containing protein [Ktedonobacterales bacterium]|nr:zinc ribbon domain-containing protein [Ktedonobacterales bacterium]
MMEHCVYCQGTLEPTTRRCKQCGRTQQEPLASTPMQAAVEAQEIQCPRCGTRLPGQARFCRRCGQPLQARQEALHEEREAEHSSVASLADRATLVQRCPVCQETLPVWAHFCSACGHALSATSEPPRTPAQASPGTTRYREPDDPHAPLPPSAQKFITRHRSPLKQVIAGIQQFSLWQRLVLGGLVLLIVAGSVVIVFALIAR